MDPMKKFRVFFWIVFSFLVVVIATGIYYFFGIIDWKDKVISDKDQKISLQEVDLIKQAKLLGDTGSLAAKDKETLTLENEQLTKDKVALTAENTNLKAGRTKAQAYNEFFRYLNSVIETHNGFTGWTDAEFQTSVAKAEATGDSAFVSTINWAWYERSVDVTTRVIRVWKEISSGIQNALK